jgi:hypothetical protein
MRRSVRANSGFRTTVPSGSTYHDADVSSSRNAPGTPAVLPPKRSSCLTIEHEARIDVRILLGRFLIT